MFSKFTEIMDCVEREFLSERVEPVFPRPLLDCLKTIERETYYLSNSSCDETLNVRVRSAAAPRAPRAYGESANFVAGGTVTLVFELSEARTGNLLVVSRVCKAFKIPVARNNLLGDADRVTSAHALAAPIDSQVER
jgi:hypothetical protein